MKTLLFSCCIFFCGQFATAQTDFFYSFIAPFSQNSDQITNSNVFAIFEVGEEGQLNLFYTSDGPANSGLDTLFVDIETSTSKIIEFSSAETFDYDVELVCLQFVGTRWSTLDETGVVGDTGKVSDSLIDELHAIASPNAFAISDATNCDVATTVLCDKGFVGSNANAFHVACIEFTATNLGTVDILTTKGSGGISLEGKNLDVSFGLATIYVIVLGDVNGDGKVDLLDISPFVAIITNGGFQVESDVNRDGVVNILDVPPLIEILTS